MNQENPYDDVRFSDDVCEMFAEIILQHKTTRDILLFVAECSHKRNYATITTIRKNIIIPRRVGQKQKKSLKFEIEEMNIDRKTAEKTVERLYFMSLIYMQPKLPYKEIHLSPRGTQVVLKISEKLRKSKEITQ